MIRNTIFAISLFLLTSVVTKAMLVNQIDSAYIFAYGTDKNNYHNGLHFAWSINQKNWQQIGPEYAFVKSDYGRWGEQKKMMHPFLYQAPDGHWHCVWSLNEQDGAFAYTSSVDLIYWITQSYPLVIQGGNCLQPTISGLNQGQYLVSWTSDKGDKKDRYAVTTTDFKRYSPARRVEIDRPSMHSILLSGQTQQGTIHKVAWSVIDKLIKAQQLNAFKQVQNNETASQDAVRFATLKPVEAKWHINTQDTKPISDLLMGIFFEDINYAADGGLYAELIQNRGFEYSNTDRKEWHALTGWAATATDVQLTAMNIDPVHVNNANYVVIKSENGGGIQNSGFGGIAIKAGEQYDFSVFARNSEAAKGHLLIRLVDTNGKTVAQGKTGNLSKKWKKHNLMLSATATVADARLEVLLQNCDVAHLDMVSLFPKQTFHTRQNGLRADLAQVIADMKPRFVRFPGGCVAHGDGLDNIYHWKNTIGPLEARKPQRNLWGYHQSYGLGYFEYFQFCEDLGAEAVPVLAAGVPCQNSAHHGHPLGGQQCGIPLEDMPAYIQDVLDLIEYA